MFYFTIEKGMAVSVTVCVECNVNYVNINYEICNFMNNGDTVHVTVGLFGFLVVDS